MNTIDINRYSTLVVHPVLHRVEDENKDYLVMELQVDGSPLVDFDYYATDLSELVQSSERNGQFFILTCWCGSPGCAGLRHGISVTHNWSRVFWNIQEPDPSGWIIFEEKAYAQAIRDGIDEAQRLVTFGNQTNRGSDITIVPDYNEGVLSPHGTNK